MKKRYKKNLEALINTSENYYSQTLNYDLSDTIKKAK
jgi:hypothetical protein